MTSQSSIVLQERRVLCHSCSMACKTSKVYPEFPPDNQVVQSVYYDEDGRFHAHGGSKRSIKYRCSNNHTWTGVDETTCWCGWQENGVQQPQ